MRPGISLIMVYFVFLRSQLHNQLPKEDVIVHLSTGYLDIYGTCGLVRVHPVFEALFRLSRACMDVACYLKVRLEVSSQ
jgi:hypothetical protein